jgi:hypothetical protein
LLTVTWCYKQRELAVGRLLWEAHHGGLGVLDQVLLKKCVDKGLFKELVEKMELLREFTKRFSDALGAVQFVTELRGLEDVKTMKCPRDLKELNYDAFEELRDAIVRPKRNLNTIADSWHEACRTREGALCESWARL